MTTEEAVEIGADLVALTLAESVALSAPGLEEVGTLLCITCYNLAIETDLWFESCKSARKIRRQAGITLHSKTRLRTQN